jgi:hypothetical protein
MMKNGDAVRRIDMAEETTQDQAPQEKAPAARAGVANVEEMVMDAPPVTRQVQRPAAPQKVMAGPQLLPGQPAPVPHSEGGVLDTAPEEMAPYQTDDAVGSLGQLKLSGGYLMQRPGEDERVLNIAVMRATTGDEEDVLTDSTIEPYRRFQIMLAKCLTRIGDGKGEWVTDPNLMLGIVDKLTAADRAQMLIHLRIISVYPDPEKYTFRLQCKGCNKEIKHTEKLTDREVTYMEHPEKRIYNDTLPSGSVARWKVMLACDEEVIDKAQEVGRHQLSASIQARLFELNGVPVTLGMLKSMSGADRGFLRLRFEECEGGVELGTTIRCPKCGASFEGVIDIAQPGFFFPSATPRN